MIFVCPNVFSSGKVNTQFLKLQPYAILSDADSFCFALDKMIRDSKNLLSIDECVNDTVDIGGIRLPRVGKSRVKFLYFNFNIVFR